ncbi:acetyltransferase (GNAT) family protein [Azospirillum brasilense]|uniref:Acetyltransferase (GNAT) family protein n=1 Tax=Azospirillum brasilense TaxID=192 RepID=A0A560B6I4_AZOBR|nr:GNAT family N-acetyltransferase [Azospirillum brasilense]TWA68251.1 acetyltransferase (GNAT) family protein [Azospirillum brasilense]
MTQDSAQTGAQDSMMAGLTLSLSGRLDPDEVKQIHRELRAFNERFTAPYDLRDLQVTVRDGDGALMAGLTGYTNWEWLYVDYLWVHDSRRGGRLGARLLAAAEAEAVKRGCRWSRLYTYDFQAPGFYRKQGYEVWAEMEGYPPGHTQIWLRKALPRDGE